MHVFIKFIRLFLVLIVGVFFLLGSCISEDCEDHDKNSSEAKVLQQRILQTIGIPQDIIINLCQDGNKNGFCDNKELQSKVVMTLDKGEVFWEKLRKSVEGRYFLETLDPKLPILLELQDAYRVDFNEGRFTLLFSGFETNKESEVKELSVLQSMIDASYLTKNDAKGVRNLGNDYAQDKFYEYLFDGLETNLNTLGAKGFAPNEAMSRNIESMANKLVENNITTDLQHRIKECTNNECIDKELDVLSSILVIDEDKENNKRIEVQ
jgi:hypothetical protein